MSNPSEELNKILLEIDSRANTGYLYSDRISALSFILGASSLLQEELDFSVVFKDLSADFNKTMLATMLYAVQSSIKPAD